MLSHLELTSAREALKDDLVTSSLPNTGYTFYYQPLKVHLVGV